MPTVAALLTAFVAWILWLIPQSDFPHALHWRIPIDLKIYLLAGQEVAAGGDLYDAPYIGDLPFTYPPFAGVVFSWLAGLSDNWIISVWQIGTALALWVILLLVLRNRDIALRPLTVYTALVFSLASLAIEPIHGSYFFGQINVWLMLLVSLDLLPKRWRLPGVGIGLAAGLKLTPAYLGLVLLFQRRWWAALGSVVTFGFTVWLGLRLIPDAMVFWTDAIFNSSRVGEHLNPGAMALRSFLEREYGVEGGPQWIMAVVVVGILNCAAVLVAMWRGNTALAMSFSGLGACLISPFSWFHHYVWLVPLALCIFIGANQLLGRWLVESPRSFPGAGQLTGALSLLVAMASMVPFVSQTVWPEVAYRSSEDYQSIWPLGQEYFIGACILYMALYALSGFAGKSPKLFRSNSAQARSTADSHWPVSA